MRPLRVPRFPGGVPSIDQRPPFAVLGVVQVSRIEVARRVEMSDITCHVRCCDCKEVAGASVSCLSVVDYALGVWTGLV